MGFFADALYITKNQSTKYEKLLKQQLKAWIIGYNKKSQIIDQDLFDIKNDDAVDIPEKLIHSAAVGAKEEEIVRNKNLSKKEKRERQRQIAEERRKKERESKKQKSKTKVVKIQKIIKQKEEIKPVDEVKLECEEEEILSKEEKT